jgi:energy-coupling factor transporter ATP-binding protein EcfA2
MDLPSHTASRFLRQIYVEKLFGQYTYDLSLDPRGRESLSKLLILYGDNGSGKTTLLRLIFNLLGSQRNRGHRGYVAKVLFRELRIELSDGTAIAATRPKNQLLGAFRMSISKRDKLLSQVDWQVDDNMEVTIPEEDRKRVEHVLKTLVGLDLNLYLLSDDRRITKSPDTDEDEADHFKVSVSPEGRVLRTARWHRSADPRQRRAAKQGLEAAVSKVLSWATGRALESSTKGDADANALYADIVHHISSPAAQKSGVTTRLTKEKLVTELRSQAGRSDRFSRFGLIGPLNVDPFVDALRSASASNLITLENVIAPYIDSVKARLDALEPLHEAIDAFIQIFNSFYHNKTVSFDLQKGMFVRTTWGATVPLTSLSSGERQLLLLFCNIIVARDSQSIFIIDEPELSLNVKWQRRLVDTLLEFTKLNPIQFILASHSIELTSRHASHVLKLDDSVRQ